MITTCGRERELAANIKILKDFEGRPHAPGHGEDASAHSEVRVPGTQTHDGVAAQTGHGGECPGARRDRFPIRKPSPRGTEHEQWRVGAPRTRAPGQRTRGGCGEESRSASAVRHPRRDLHRQSVLGGVSALKKVQIVGHTKKI